MSFFIEGYDYGSADNGGSYKWSNPDGLLPPQVVNGRQGDYAVRWFATTGSIAASTVQRGSSRYWAVGFDLMPTDALEQDQLIWRFEDSSGTLLAVQMRTDGTLAFYVDGSGTNTDPGTLLATTIPGAHPLVLNQWTWVEMLITFGQGSLSVNFEDVNVLSRPNIQITDSRFPDRVSRVWQGYVNLHGPVTGYTLDNIYVATGQNDPFGQPRTFLGPSRVTAHFPAADAVPPQWARSGGSSDAAAVGFSVRTTPLGSTYSDGQANQLDWFGFDKPSCYGLIYAVAANANVREKVNGGNGGIGLSVRPNGQAVGTALGAAAVNSPNYSITQACSESSILNPGNRWNDGEIGNAYWGMQASPSPGYPSGAVRCGQFFLEKLTALRNLPFTCGGNPPYTW